MVNGRMVNSVSLYLGDCLNILPDITDGSVDMILSDLPYGTTACVWDSIIPLDQLWKQYRRIIKENGVVVLTAAQPFTTILASSNLKDFRYEWIWEKPQGTNPLNSKYMPLKSHENILVFYKKPPTYNPQMEKGTPYKGFSDKTSTIGEVYGKLPSIHRNNPEGTRFPKTVLRFKQDRGGLHPTQKPVSLMEYLIQTYTNRGEIVLDSTMGSGTTGVAAKMLGRKFIGIEKDQKYYNIAEDRINGINSLENIMD